jgi:tRNA-dihydrouridine synthase
VDFVRAAESAGVDFITVHGRTRKMKSTEPVDLEGIKLVSMNFILKFTYITNLTNIVFF